MPFFLTARETELIEHMDRTDCDQQMLVNTYQQFGRINKMLSNWGGIYKKYLKPRMDSAHSYSLLDVGFGGGDIPLLISRLAKADGFDLNITAIDLDERAYEYSKQLPQDDKVLFRNCGTVHMLNYGNTFDFVISNHLLHHLDEDVLLKTLRETEQLADRLVIFNDIERSDLGFVLFNVFSRPMFKNSFITEDGLISIRKSFTKNELKNLVPKNWKVNREFPFRLLLTYP